MMEILKDIFASNVFWFVCIPALIVAIFLLQKYWPGASKNTVVKAIEDDIDKAIEKKTGVDVESMIDGDNAASNLTNTAPKPS
jgi:hypothetical protein